MKPETVKTTFEVATIVRDRLGNMSVDEIAAIYENVVGDTIYYMGDSMWTTSSKDLVGLFIEAFMPKFDKLVRAKIIKVNGTNAEVMDQEGNKHNFELKGINKFIVI